MTQQTRLDPTPGALNGVRVVEMGQLIAGPFCGKTLGEFGADVVKIEAPARAIRCATGA
jgi:formyl-CoA transferase